MGTCHYLNVEKEEWNSHSLPQLNVNRYLHSSISFTNRLFVVCGYSDEYLKSIELLKLRLKNDGSVSSISKAWDIFEP